MDKIKLFVRAPPPGQYKKQFISQKLADIQAADQEGRRGKKRTASQRDEGSEKEGGKEVSGKGKEPVGKGKEPVRKESSSRRKDVTAKEACEEEEPGGSGLNPESAAARAVLEPPEVGHFKTSMNLYYPFHFRTQYPL